VWSVSLELLIDFLAYLAKIMDPKPKICNELHFHKRCPWVYYNHFMYGHHSPEDLARELFISSAGGEVL